MIAVFKMSSQKKEKFSNKIDKMMDFLEEFKECLEEAEDYEDDEVEDEMMSRRYRGGSSSSPMRNRYSRRGGM